MQLINGKEFLDNIIEHKLFCEQKLVNLIKPIFFAVERLHDKNISHGDIKADNIIIENEKATLVDFGIDSYLPNLNQLTRKIDSPFYLAPEIIKSSTYDLKGDSFALGVLIFLGIAGVTPFGKQNDTEQKIFNSILNDPLVFEEKIWGKKTENLKDLLRKLLAKELSERISIQQALQHPWFTTSIDAQNNVISEEEMIELHKQFKNFKANSMISNGLSTFFLNYLSIEKEKEHLTENFQALDTNKDGTISKEELKNSFENWAHLHFSENEFEELFNNADLTKDNKIDYNEFVRIMAEKKKILSKERLENIFKNFDQDGDGHIKLEILKNFVVKDGKMKEEFWNEIVKDVQCDENGNVEYAQFQKIASKLIDIN